MASVSDVVKLIGELQIVSTGDGFDVTLSDAQVEAMKNSLRKAVLNPSTGKTNPVRITNMRRVILPVAWELAWPYVAMVVGAGVLAGVWIAKGTR